MANSLPVITGKLTYVENEHQCLCKPPWFWLSSIEQDEKGRGSAECHAVLLTSQVLTVDPNPRVRRTTTAAR